MEYLIVVKYILFLGVYRIFFNVDFKVDYNISVIKC